MRVDRFPSGIRIWCGTPGETTTALST
jgi:hypothetical protein